MSEFGPIADAWKRVKRIADENCLPVDNRESLVRALAVLRDEIRKNPRAEAELQRRARWVAERVGPGSELPRLIKAIVDSMNTIAALGEPTLPHQEKLAVEVLSAASKSSIDSLQKLQDIGSALGWLTGRTERVPDIGKAYDLVDAALNAAMGDEVEAAVALVETTALRFDTRITVIGDEASGVAIVESVPLDGVGQLVDHLTNLPTVAKRRFNDVVTAKGPRLLYAKLEDRANQPVAWNDMPEDAFRDRNNIHDGTIHEALRGLSKTLNSEKCGFGEFGELSISEKDRTATLKLSPEK